MRSPAFFRILLALTALLHWRCSDRVAGGTTEVGNSGVIAGTISTPDGTAARGARVSLLPASFDPGSGPAAMPPSWTVSTDAKGGYRVESAVPGDYNLLVRDSVRGTSALMRDIHLPGVSGPLRSDARLASSGALSMTLTGASAGAYFYLPGTDIFRKADSTDLAAGRIVLNGVPPGTYPELIQVLPGSPVRNVLGRPVEVEPDEPVDLGPYPEWSSLRILTVSPAAAGAAPSAHVLGFPLLVRLTADDLGFSKARPNGEDLRVTKADGRTPLPFEIESWDAVNRQAAVWIAVDTLFAGGASQSFFLYSGNSAAPTAGNPAAVFDTASGFVGVWHLGAGLQDATVFRNDGTGTGAAPGAGLIGAARHFDGKAQYIDVKDHSSLAFGSGDFTFSAWVYGEAWDTTRQVFAKRADSSNYEMQVTSEGTVQVHVHDRSANVLLLMSKTRLNANAWNHIVYVRSGGKATLYLNALVEDGPLDCPALVQSGAPLRIGDDNSLPPGEEGFLGLIDELEFSRRARNADWIRLMHATQKPGAAVVRVAPLP